MYFRFDPEFETYCDEMAQKLVANKTDKNIIGYFSDNELPFGPKNLEGYLTLKNPNDPGRLYAESRLKQQGITLQQITDEHREEFAGVVAERYYKVVSEAIRKYDPNHLYLGSRLHGKPKFIRQIVEAAGRYCDVVAINYYGAWTPNEKTMKHWGEWAQNLSSSRNFIRKEWIQGWQTQQGQVSPFKPSRNVDMPISILFWDYWKVGIVSDGIGSVIRIMIRRQKGRSFESGL